MPILAGMTEETDRPPLARMRTINRPSFWLFILSCMALYTCGIFFVPQITASMAVTSLLALCVFTALLLELVAQKIKNSKTAYYFTLACYVFEAFTIVTFALIIFI